MELCPATLAPDMLAEVSATIGLPGFAAGFDALCRDGLAAQDGMAFILPDRSTPRLLFRSDQPHRAPSPADGRYFGGEYRLDDNLHNHGTLAQPAVRIIDAHDRALHPSQRAIYAQAGVGQMLTLVSRTGDLLLCLGFYKRAGQRFADREVARIHDARGLLQPVLLRHHQLALLARLTAMFDADGTLRHAAHRHAHLSDITLLFTSQSALSLREAQVCARAMIGHTIEGTARDMGLAPGTIRVHRANAFARLNISSVQELFPAYARLLAEHRATLL